MQYTSPQEYLFTLFRISMVFGFALAFPVIGFQLWRSFVAPGLFQRKGVAVPNRAGDVLLGASFARPVVTVGDGAWLCGCRRSLLI
jgi:sec-independent protein translocase protein TatC